MEYDYDQALQTETPVQSMVSLHKKLDISRYASFMQSIIITKKLFRNSSQTIRWIELKFQKIVLMATLFETIKFRRVRNLIGTRQAS